MSVPKSLWKDLAESFKPYNPLASEYLLECYNDVDITGVSIHLFDASQTISMEAHPRMKKRTFYSQEPQ